MEKCETKVIQADLSILTWHIQTNSSISRHIQELLGHIQVYSEPSVTLA